MKKTARKTSADPAQEALRDAKNTWNNKVSRLLEHLLEFKLLMNGLSSKKFVLQSKRHSLTQKLPLNPDQVLNFLVQELTARLKEAKDIVKQQEEYSKKRKKNMKERTVPEYNPDQLEFPFSRKTAQLLEILELSKKYEDSSIDNG